MIVLQLIIIILFLALLVLGFVHRNMPRVGGKLGPIRNLDPPPALPGGFSRSYARANSAALRSTRFDELMWRGDFMRAEVAPKALRARQLL